MSLTNNTSELNNISGQISAIKNEYISQTKLISQIKEVLQKKASGELPDSKLAQVIDGTLMEITASDLQGATNIRTGAFYYSPVTSVEIPNSVTEIGNYAFQYCSQLASVTMGNGVTSIGASAFLGCSSLINIEMPNSVTTVGSHVFAGCSSLVSIKISNSIKGMTNYMFQNCSSLTSIEIPNSITSMGNSVFNACSSLTNVTIPSSVTSIGANALYIGSTSNKATITFLSTTPPSIQSNTFDITRLQNIIVPKGYGDIYKAATNWSIFADYIIESET